MEDMSRWAQPLVPEALRQRSSRSARDVFDDSGLLQQLQEVEQLEHSSEWRAALYVLETTKLDIADAAVCCKSCRAPCCSTTDLLKPMATMDGVDPLSWLRLDPSGSACLRLEHARDTIPLGLGPAEVHVAACLTCGVGLGWAFKEESAAEDFQRVAIQAISAGSFEVTVPAPQANKVQMPAAPTGITLLFHSIGDELEIAWCNETCIWHSRLGSTVSVVVECVEAADLKSARKMRPSSPSKCMDARRLAFPFCLQPVNRVNAGHIEMSTTMPVCARHVPNSQTFSLQACTGSDDFRGRFSGSWTGRDSGEVSFHARWSSSPQSPSKRSTAPVRVFANVAAVCVHPLWEEACSRCCELVVEEVSPVNDTRGLLTWNLRCGVRLYDILQRLHCPSTVAEVEVNPTGQSFHGIGPSPARWLPSVSYADSDVGFDDSGPVVLETKAFVDINEGIIWYVLRFQAVPAELSLSMLERSSCQPVKGSPQTLVPPQALLRIRKPLSLIPLVSQPLEPTSPSNFRTTTSTIAPRGIAESKQPLLHEPDSNRDGVLAQPLSQTSPTAGARADSRMEQAAEKSEKAKLFRVQRPASMMCSQRNQEAMARHPVLSPRSSGAESPSGAWIEKPERKSVPRIDCRTQPANAPEAIPSLEATAVVPPGRYMPAQPLPSQVVVVRRKHKSKSPSKRAKSSRRWAEA
ncbi:unnamed protein product [Symbiodinium natans]|uniref:Yippee domain-containing protein n=1 Tax=Symbiodinium natans TaxID=878477 RepID=A0A812RLY2_9DINO|nr:unnamed protein product [Symbiodinium natans]